MKKPTFCPTALSLPSSLLLFHGCKRLSNAFVSRPGQKIFTRGRCFKVTLSCKGCPNCMSKVESYFYYFSHGLQLHEGPFSRSKVRNFCPPLFTRIHCAVSLSYRIVYRESLLVHGSGIGEENWPHEVQRKDCKTLTLSKFRMAPDGTPSWMKIHFQLAVSIIVAMPFEERRFCKSL